MMVLTQPQRLDEHSAIQWQWLPGPSLVVQSPSNLALIKYMGKLKPGVGLNSSFSITLPHLITQVRISPGNDSDEVVIAHLEPESPGYRRFTQAVGRLKQMFGIDQPLRVESENSFPSDAGIASSSSAFSALTLALWLWANHPFVESGQASVAFKRLPYISATLSGASGRSFFQPACLWVGRRFLPVIFEPCINGYHAVFGVDVGPKPVSSSQAHQRVQTSLLIQGRGHRARIRLHQLWSYRQQDYISFELFQIVWQEFWDMHALFETSNPSFGYLLPLSLEIIQFWRHFWEKNGWGPLVTLDAGANVHVIFDRYRAFEAAQQVADLSQDWGVPFWGGYLSDGCGAKLQQGGSGA